MNQEILKTIDASWTLFLDRDGVINNEVHLKYVNNWEEFDMYEGVLEAFKIFNEKFGLILIITNQRGVAKGITKAEDLSIIHENMTADIVESGGRIDKIYFCTDMEDTSANRKPNPGMALQAKIEFPSIDFSKSIMIGNTLGDMGFGRNAGIAINVFLPTTKPETIIPNPLIDLVFSSLLQVAKAL